MNCVKCGAELRDDQKVCIQCGTRTAAGGHFHIEEKEAWKPTRNMIYAAAGVVVVLILALIINSFMVVPPEVVTVDWLNAMLQRDYNKAQRYHAREFTDRMQDGVSDTRAISDYLYEDIVSTKAQYSANAPTLPAPDQATVIVPYSSPGGDSGQVTVTLAKSGRRWLITSVTGY